MVVWIALVAYVALVRAFLGKLDTRRLQKKFLFLAGIAVALVIGLRGDNYGSVYDLRVYVGFYNDIMSASWQNIFKISDFEVGYVVLNKLLSIVFPFSQAIVLFEAGFCVFAVCHYIYHNTENVFWAFYFYVTLGSMGFMLTGFRQSIAIAFCLLSVQFIKNKKLIRFVLFALIAYSIHVSALVFIAAYIIAGNSFINRHKTVLVFVVILMMVFAPQILNFGSFVSDGELTAPGEAVYSFNGIVPIAIYVLGLFTQLYLSKIQNKREAVKNVTAPLLAVGLGFYLMRFYNMILERLSFYYTQASYVALADFWKMIKPDKYRSILKLITFVLAFALFFKRLQNAHYANYIFFWMT